MVQPLARLALVSLLAACGGGVCAGCGTDGGAADAGLPVAFQLTATLTDGIPGGTSCVNTPTWVAWFSRIDTATPTYEPLAAAGSGDAPTSCLPLTKDGATWRLDCETVGVDAVFDFTSTVTFDGEGGGGIAHAGVRRTEPTYRPCATAYRIDSIVEDLDGL